MRKSIISLAVLTTISDVALAGSKFDGFNSSLGIGILNAHSIYDNSNDLTYEFDISGNLIFSPISGSSKNNSSATLGLSTGYSQSLSNQFNLATSFFFNVGNLNQNYHSNEAAIDLSGNQIVDTRFKLKNIWGGLIEPGYYFNQDTLGYLKLGYAFISIKANTSSNDVPWATQSANYDFGSAKGFLYGLGIKHAITENIFVTADFYRINFSSKQKIASDFDYYDPSTSSSVPGNLYFNTTVNQLDIKAGYTFK